VEKKGEKIDGTINQYYSDEPYIYIGDEWKFFCIRNKFKIGDMIRFKFANVHTSHMVHVFKIDI
jgi:ribosome-associated toxin RatA of RatAB toxin-antitoxin module